MLSNDEHAWKLRRDVPEAGEFDEATLQALQEGHWDDLLRERRLVRRAKPQADLRHLEVLRGFLGTDAKGQVHCYESGHGVGSALVQFTASQPSDAVASPGDD
jgi:aromatic ring-opening dioxygenase LigB subunit